jgi:hypothetical protein
MMLGISTTAAKKPPNGLPDKVLAKIFSYLPLGTRQNVLPFVCPRFHDFIRDFDQIKTIHVHEGAVISGLTERDLRRMVEGHRSMTVTSVYVYGDKIRHKWDFLDAGGVLATVWWKNVESFTMTGKFPVFDSKHISRAARLGFLRTLKRLVLRLETWPVPCTGLKDWDMPNLRSLELETGPNHRAFLRNPGPGPFNHMRLKRLKLGWAPDEYWRDCELPFSFSRFVNAVLPPSVTELTLTTNQHGNFSLRGISGRFPNVKLLRVDFLMLMTIKERPRIAHELLRVFCDLWELVLTWVPNLDVWEFAACFGDVFLHEVGTAWSCETVSMEVDGVTIIQGARYFR